MFRIAIRHRRRPNYEGRRRASTVPTNNTSSSCLNQSQKSEISEFERRVLAVLEGKRKLGTDTQAHVHGRLTAGAWSLLLQHFLKIKDNSNSASTTHQQLLLLEASNAYLRSAAYSVNLPNSLLDLVTSVERDVLALALGTSVSQQRRPTETTPSSSSSPSTVSVIQPETAALVARNTLLMLYQSSSASSDSAVSSSSNNNTQPLLSNNEGIACANRAFHLLQRAVSSSSKPSSTTSIDGKGGSSPQASLTPRFESLHHIAQTAHVLGYGALGRWDRIDKIIMYHNRPPVKSSSPSSHQESIVGSLLVTCSLIQTLLHHHNTTKASGTSSSSATYNTAHRVDALHVIKLQLYPRLRLDLTRIDWSCSAAVTNILDDSFALDLVSTAISSIFKIESALYYHSLQAFPATHFDVNGSRINIGTVQHPLAPPSPAANNEEELALIKCREDLLAAVHSHQRSRQVKSMATSSPSSSSSSILQTKLLDVIDLATLSGLVEILETRAKPANMYTYPVFDKTSRREKLQRRKGLHDMVELVFGSLSCRHPSFLDPFEAISIRCDRSNNSSTSSNASSSAFKTALLAPNTSLAQLGQLPHLVIRYMVEHFIDTPYRQISDTYVFLRQVMYKVVDDFRSQGFVMTAQTYHFLMRGANRVYTVDRRMDVNHLPNKIHPSIAVSLESSSSLPSSSSSSPKPTSSLSSSSPTIYHEYTFQESLSLRKQKYYTFLTLLNWMRRSDIQPTAETFAHGFQSTISHVPEYRRVTADYGFRLFGRRNVVMHMEILMSSARFNKLSHNRASLISLIQAYSANGEFESAAARFEQARVFLDNDRGSELYCTMLKECALHLRDGARDYALKQLRFSIRREPFWIKAEKDAAVKFRFLKSSSSSDSFFKVLPPPPPRSCYNRDSLSSSTYSAATIYSSDFECHLWLLVAAARDMKRTLAEMWEVYECMRNMFPTTRLPDWVFDVMMYRFENVYAMNLAGKEWEEKIRPRLERERHANLFI